MYDNTSSSEGSLRQSATQSSRPLTATSTEERQADQAEREAEARMHLPDYVEARGVLLPATEYLRQAVETAMAQQILHGDLLVIVSCMISTFSTTR